jgi:uncharacterized protein (TIGR03437 family)
VVRFSLAILTISPLGAQLLVDTYAGGHIQSGVPANNVTLGTISGITWDPSGNIVFSDEGSNVIRRINADGTVQTIAGTGVTGFGGDGGPALSALVYFPMNLQYDGAGNLYFFDADNHRIRRIDSSGIITTIAGDGQIPVAGLDTTGPATSRSVSLYFMAVDLGGIVYFADGSGDILRVQGGNTELLAQVPSVVPGGLAADPAGNVYFLSQFESYTNPQALYRISPGGTISTIATFSVGSLPPPGAFLTSDLAGNVYDYVNGQLTRYAPDGTTTVLSTPGVIGGFPAISPPGTIGYVTTGPTNLIKEFTPQSGSTTVAGAAPKPAPNGTPLRDAWFLGPIWIAFSHAGDLYVSESQACLIRKISAAGVLSTFAGTGTCGYPAPVGTTAATANLSPPGSIAFDSEDNLWIADSYVNLYSISPQGALSAPVKTPVSGGSGNVAADAQNRVYVLGLNSLYRVLSDGSYEGLIVPPSTPGCCGLSLSGIGADSSGNVYFGNAGPPTPNVYVANNDLTYSLKVPDFGGRSFTFDPSGNIWGNNGTLNTFKSTGNAVVGRGYGFAGDGGPLQSALMSAYISMVFGPDGDLYFVDYSLRRVTGSGPATPPVISQSGIVNAVSYAGGSIAPGELISIFGSNFGASALQVNSAVNNAIPFTIGRTKVLFNGQPGAITAITPTQINVFVPYEVVGPVNVQVQVDNILSKPVSIPVAPTAPGLSPSILNQDGTLNTASNPAPRGSVVYFYGTGLGAMTPQLVDGNLAISTPYSMPVAIHRRPNRADNLCRRCPHTPHGSLPNQRDHPHSPQSRPSIGFSRAW